MSAPVAAWSHVALNCRDQAATERFYRRHLGFRRVRAVSTGEGAEIVFVRRGPVLLELFPAAGPTAREAVGPEAAGPEVAEREVTGPGDGPATPGTVRHIAFTTEDVDDFLAHLGDEARVSLGPLSFDAVIPGWRTVWLLDPDDVVVEVSQGYRDEVPDGWQENDDD